MKVALPVSWELKSRKGSEKGQVRSTQVSLQELQ